MDEKLYYEVSVTTSNDIKNAYEHAVANNIKSYRCIAKDGSIYGWDNGKYIKAKEGQKWFENTDYKEPENAVDPNICLNEHIFEEENITVEEMPETTKIVTETKAVNYEVLYKETYEILQSTQNELANWIKAYNSVKEELDGIKNAFATIAKEIKKADEKTE